MMKRRGAKNRKYRKRTNEKNKKEKMKMGK
jgi:hypothetical protein